MSDANREQLGRLLGDMWGAFLADIAAARTLTPAALQRLADERGLLRAAQMKDLGLADRVAYVDEVIGELKELTGADEDDRTFRQVPLLD